MRNREQPQQNIEIGGRRMATVADGGAGDQHVHVQWMRQALREAEVAFALGEVPVGAVLVHDGQIVARAHNLRETLKDPTAHAELLAIRDAARRLNTWRLAGTTCYVTLEPCAMCAGALVLARVDRLVYGATDPKAGAVTSLYAMVTDARLNHRLQVIGDVLADDAAELLRQFFQARRS
jgi:tRNA(adenine34) deaminase